jgi:hypothetical protein
MPEYRVGVHSSLAVSSAWGHAMQKTDISKIARAGPRKGAMRTPASIISGMKARQSAKIQELRQSLVHDGFVTIDEQARVLALSRSTAWTVMRGNHKCSGLSAATIKRMLSSPLMPPSARMVLLEYVEEKSTGIYGHSKNRLRLFRSQLRRTNVELANVDRCSAA